MSAAAANASETMMALVHDGKGGISLQDRPFPRIEHPQDAIVRVTMSSICTSDLHIMHGSVPRALPDTVLGHEFVGVVEEVGADVRGFDPGDRVAVNVETFCGSCFFCERGYVNNCVEGGWELGCRIDGCQAEYVRVPLANQGLTHIPDTVSDKEALLLGDVLATGVFGAGLAEIKPGDTVAVIGAGPVGQCAMLCARNYGPANIIAIDIDADRLSMARSHGACDACANPTVEDIEKAVLAATCGRGADAVIECAGGANTFEMAWKIARPNAVVSLMALYEEDQAFPLPRMYGKNLVFKTGGVDARGLDRTMNLIAAGKLDTSYLMTHSFPLNRIEEAYRFFAAHEDGCMKVAITPYER